MWRRKTKRKSVEALSADKAIRTLDFTASKIGLELGCVKQRAVVKSFQEESERSTLLQQGINKGLVNIGDIIVRINGSSTIGMSYKEVLLMIRESERPFRISFQSHHFDEVGASGIIALPEDKRICFAALLFYLLEDSAGSYTDNCVGQYNPENKTPAHTWAKKLVGSMAKDFLGFDEDLCRAIEVLPPKADIEPLIESLLSISPKALLEETIAAFVLLCILNQCYDARVRYSVRRIGVENLITGVLLKSLKNKHIISDSDQEDLTEDQEDSVAEEYKENRRKRNKLYRWGMIGGATLIGGTLIAVTGGLAAPAIAAGLAGAGGAVGGIVGGGIGASIATAAVGLSAFIATAGGTAVLVGLFGSAGSGLIGYKMEFRTRGVSEFKFNLCSGGHGVSIVLCVAGWINKPDDFVRLWGARNVGTLEDADDNSTKARSDDNSSLKSQNEDEENIDLWWPRNVPDGDHYTLTWESKELHNLSGALGKFAASTAATYAGVAILKTTAINALMAAVAWPATILAAGDLIDNSWSVAKIRADSAGAILADALISKEYGRRPVTLVGFGLGGRLIFKCLLQIAQMTREADPDGNGVNSPLAGIVENVVIFGAAVNASPEQWSEVRRVVSGRIVNGYCKDDWVLAILFRADGSPLHLGKTVSGLGPVTVNGIENVNVGHGKNGHRIVSGHLDYGKKLKELVAIAQLGTNALECKQPPQNTEDNLSDEDISDPNIVKLPLTPDMLNNVEEGLISMDDAIKMMPLISSVEKITISESKEM